MLVDSKAVYLATEMEKLDFFCRQLVSARRIFQLKRTNGSRHSALSRNSRLAFRPARSHLPRWFRSATSTKARLLRRRLRPRLAENFIKVNPLGHLSKLQEQEWAGPRPTEEIGAAVLEKLDPGFVQTPTGSSNSQKWTLTRMDPQD